MGVTSLPVSADLENGFADDAEGVAETVRLAVQAGLAGCSIEDATGRGRQPDLRRRPINVLALPDAPTVAELADAGVARVSVGGAFAFAVLGAFVDTAQEFLTLGTHGFTAQTRKGRERRNRRSAEL